MVFLTADVSKKADILGIDNNSKQKLYRTARSIENFLNEYSQTLSQENEQEFAETNEQELEEEYGDYN